MDAAFLYARDPPAVSRIFYGRLRANHELAAALARNGSGPFHCVTPSQDDMAELRAILDARGAAGTPLVAIQGGIAGLARTVGTLFRPDPNLAEAAWHRRQTLGDTAISICGLTHSLSTLEALDWIGSYTIAPLRPWDALICTSKAAKSLVLNLFQGWWDFLGERMPGARPAQAGPCLPVIPLGVDCAGLAPDNGAREAGRRLRNALGLADNTVVLLHAGRLDPWEKAHPFPMFLAMERASAKCGSRLALVLCGRFQRPEDAGDYATAAAALCPSVDCRILDGGRPDVWRAAWACADIFLSLSDNVQETFGLTPVEAMAAGLPAVVSDWDGYRDTVRDGETGFLVPTLLPPAGAGRDISLNYVRARDYRQTIARIAMNTVVDLDGAAWAIARLADDPALRGRMGGQGRRRALAEYDWARITSCYHSLWAELRERRLEAQVDSAPRPRCGPHYPDPFSLYRAFAAGVPADTWTIRPCPGWLGRLRWLAGNRLATEGGGFAADRADQLAELLADIEANGPRTLVASLGRLDGAGVADPMGLVFGGAKFGLLRMDK